MKWKIGGIVITKGIEDPLEIDWAALWAEKVKIHHRKGKKDWNKAAKDFGKISKGDNYKKSLFSKMKLSSEDTVLDLGCGEGSITIPLAKKVKSVTAVDSSSKMLELLEEKIEKENITNINIIHDELENITLDDVGNHDTVLSSRSINGIVPIKETLKNINEIANKYVYLTVFGPNDFKFREDFYKTIGVEVSTFPPYQYLFNILVSMNIYPNIENLEIKDHKSYESVHEAIERGRWNLNEFNKDEEKQLIKYLKEKLKLDENGKLYHEDDRMDWVLFWWKK